MTEPKSALEQLGCLAIRYIRARRLKLDAKDERNRLAHECDGRADHNVLCVVASPDDPVEWCDACERSTPYHETFRRQSNKAAALLRSLERKVKTLNGDACGGDCEFDACAKDLLKALANEEESKRH